MTARYTVYLRQHAKGWEWSKKDSPTGWWGYYKTRGHAVGAAKRSLPQVVGGKTNPKDFDFIDVPTETETP